MAKFSSAYSDLIHRIREVTEIVAIGRRFARPTQAELMRSNALGRAGVVLLCSHIEGYVEALGALAVARIAERSVPKHMMAREFRYHLSRDLIDRINESTDPDRIAARIDSLLYRDINIWDTSAKFAEPLPVEAFVSNFSTPKHSNIRRFFRRFGYADFERELASRLNVNYNVCTNMIDHVVDERNKIAHGDSRAGVTPSELQVMCEFVRLYCRSTDQVVGNWFREIGCPIR